jgi:hypothetical protein
MFEDTSIGLPGTPPRDPAIALSGASRGLADRAGAGFGSQDRPTVHTGEPLAALSTRGARGFLARGAPTIQYPILRADSLPGAVL